MRRQGGLHVLLGRGGRLLWGGLLSAGRATVDDTWLWQGLGEDGEDGTEAVAVSELQGYVRGDRCRRSMNGRLCWCR